MGSVRIDPLRTNVLGPGGRAEHFLSAKISPHSGPVQLGLHRPADAVVIAAEQYGPSDLQQNVIVVAAAGGNDEIGTMVTWGNSPAVIDPPTLLRWAAAVSEREALHVIVAAIIGLAGKTDRSYREVVAQLRDADAQRPLSPEQQLQLVDLIVDSIELPVQDEPEWVE